VINSRFLIKSLSYRIFGSIATSVIAFLITGSITVGAVVGVIDTFSKIWLYYVHELLWQKLEKIYDSRKNS